jgi:drug/metabolite transporter (DMT)-like permease
VSIYEFAALAAAMTWAFSAVLAAGPSTAMGAIAFNRLRMAIVLVMLLVFVAATGGWRTVSAQHLAPLLLSGFIGIFMGDSALFLTMNRLGPRRTNILFASNAPFAAILGWFFLGETLVWQKVAGIAVVFTGIIVAIIFGKRRSQLGTWEEIKGSLPLGVALGLAAGACQAVGSLIARPVMEAGVDPATASAIRVAVAVFGLSALIATGWKPVQQKQRATPRMVLIVGISGSCRHGPRHDLRAVCPVGRQDRHCRHPFGDRAGMAFTSHLAENRRTSGRNGLDGRGLRDYRFRTDFRGIAKRRALSRNPFPCAFQLVGRIVPESSPFISPSSKLKAFRPRETHSGPPTTASFSKSALCFMPKDASSQAAWASQPEKPSSR